MDTTDIQKLQDMLTRAGIPFEFTRNDEGDHSIVLTMGEDEAGDPTSETFVEFAFCVSSGDLIDVATRDDVEAECDGDCGSCQEGE